MTGQVAVVAVVMCRGGPALVDRDGRVLARGVCLDRLGPMTAEAAVAWAWHDSVRRMADCLNARLARDSADPWLRRAEGLAKSFALRGRGLPCRGGRRVFDRYATKTWPEAAKRLVEQGHNRLRVRSRSGWERWAYTVSNNEKKRAVAHERRTNHSETGA